MGDHATGYSEKDSSFRAPPVGKLGILPGDPIPQPPMSDVVRGHILNLIVNHSSVSCKKVTLLQILSIGAGRSASSGHRPSPVWTGLDPVKGLAPTTLTQLTLVAM